MIDLFGIPLPALLGQLLLGLVNGSFYAMLSLGLAVIFGLLGIVNFAHGALYMIGAYVAWYSLERFGLNYWFALVLAPLVVGALGVVIGGMGSILGSILTGLALGLIEGLTKVFYPEASNIVVFVIMAIVLMIRPAGLFGKEK